jgi:hypothetical protein
VATRNAETYSKINAMSADLTVEAVNSKVSEQAINYVYGIDDRQLRFVATTTVRLSSSYYILAVPQPKVVYRSPHYLLLRVRVHEPTPNPACCVPLPT